MKHVLDESTGETLVEVDMPLLERACSRPGTGVLAPTKDQALLLGIDWPLEQGWPGKVAGTRIPLGVARSVIALGDRQTRKWVNKREPLTLFPT